MTIVNQNSQKEFIHEISYQNTNQNMDSYTRFIQKHAIHVRD